MLSPIEMLSRINRFYEDRKLLLDKIQEAAENIARRAEEDPTMLGGITLEDCFSVQELDQNSRKG